MGASARDRSSEYGEAQLREEFVNPLFKALGWDVYNEEGRAAAYKEVIHEAAIKVGGQTKAPDYCFRAGGGRPSFFVEAKKPAVDIGEAVSPAYQLRRYAWSAKLPVSILTDFEELAVYDCRIRPAKTDKAATARILYCTYREYVPRWDELYGLFSPKAIQRGALDRFVASKKVKKGTAEVDVAFLGELFQRADERYNSGLFHFTPEKDRNEPPDELTLALVIDDNPLKDIIQSLYYPESPYEFSVLPAEILGQVYEQFLGKVIRVTKGHQAKVEEKPEVRKAGGVYYTPAYIVDYFKQKCAALEGAGEAYLRFFGQYLEEFPVRLPARPDKRRDRIEELVEGMLSLNARLREVRTEHEREVLKRQIAATDRQIDQSVYELYGLTDEEIKIAEEALP